MTDLRPLDEADYPALLRAIDTWWTQPGLETEAARVQRAALVPRLFLQHFADTSYAIEREGELVAFLIGFHSQTRPDESYIHFVGVSPAHRRGGHGRRLYQRFFDDAARAGRTAVRCITSPGNALSIAYHRALGFELEYGGAVQRDYDGPGLDRVAFVRRLDR
jgi:predicted GNAT superfamily acetyltransferase